MSYLNTFNYLIANDVSQVKSWVRHIARLRPGRINRGDLHGWSGSVVCR